ncbi:MAG: alkaline phosphatase family protein, partial [Vampirovibrionia bacterium]
HSYKYNFTSFHTLQEPPIWNIINKELKKSSVIINMPSTFPVRQMNGVLVSGFVSPVLDKSVYPASLLPYLKDINYSVDINLTEIAGDKERLLNSAMELIEKREQLLDYLWERVDWQFLTCVITGTDRLHHFLMDAFDNELHPLNNQFESYYKKVDDFIGRVKSKLTDNDRLILLSDHGFEVTNKEVYLNNYLIELGLLENVGNGQKSLENISTNTKVFALDPSRIYVNRADKYSRGVLMSDQEYLDLLIYLENAFLNLKSPDGASVIYSVKQKNDIYNGQFYDNAPDLVLIPEKGFSLKASTITNSIFNDPEIHTGHHNYHDAFLASNLKFNLSFKPSIMDIVPTVLNLMQIDISKYNFDGTPLAISS